MSIWNINELIRLILSKISDGITYKNTLLVCRLWHNCSEDRVEDFVNIPFTLWTYQYKWSISINIMDVIDNPNISLADLEEISPELLNCSEINKNPNITWEFIQSHQEIPWNFHILSKYPVITWNIVETSQKHCKKRIRVR